MAVVTNLVDTNSNLSSQVSEYSNQMTDNDADVEALTKTLANLQG